MKRKLLIVLTLLLLVCGCSKSNEQSKQAEIKIEEYNSDIKCSVVSEENINGDTNIYTGYVYIWLDEDKNVTKAIFQNISESTVLDKANIELTNQFLNLYKDIEGIEATSQVSDNKLVITISYDYLKIDPANIGQQLGTIVSDENALKQATTLPFSYEYFKKTQLDGYECK